MTIDLKPYFDAAQAADAEVQRILSEMDAAFKLGTDEGTKKAKDLRPTLDAAKVKAVDANTLYLSMRDASGASNEVAKQFTPISTKNPKTEGSEKIMLRSKFEELNPDKRMEYIRSGGITVDALPE